MAAETAEFEKVERVEEKDSTMAHIEKLENWDELALKYKGLEQYDKMKLEEIKMDANGDPIFDDGEEPVQLIPIEFPNLQTEEDGYLGIPKFSQLDLDVLKRIGIDAEILGVYAESMKDALVDKNRCEAASKELDGEEDTEVAGRMKEFVSVSLENSIFNYNHYRNLMLLHKIVATEYATIVKEGSEEVFKVIGANIDKAIKLYIDSEPSTEDDVDFAGNNLVQVMTYRALRSAKNTTDDIIYKLATSKTKVEFETLLMKTLNMVSNNVTNLQRSCELEKLSPDEAGVVKVVRTITSQFRIHSYHLPHIEEQPSFAPTDLANYMMLNLNHIAGATAATEYKNERKKWKNEVGREKKTNKKMYGSSTFHANRPFHDVMLRKRLNALFTDMKLLKKMYIGSLIITPENADKFTENDLITKTETLKEAYMGISGHEIFERSVKALVSTFIYYYVFDEFAKIVTLFHETCQGQHDGTALLKSKNNHDFKKLRHYLMITCFQEKNTAEPFYTMDKGEKEEEQVWVKRCERVRHVYFEYVRQLFDRLKNHSMDLEKFL